MTSERTSIQRVFGKNSISNTDLILVLKSLFSAFDGENIKLDGSSAFLSEKMDAVYCCFGIDSNEKFFMSSNNSGPITSENKQKFNNIYLNDFYESFSYLEKLEPFQGSLKQIYNHIGPVKFCAELFPVLTHKGDEAGDVVFVATKYNKKNLGEAGSFFVFDANRWNPSLNEWVEFEDDKHKSMAIEELIEADTSKWRIYELSKHGKVNGVLNADLSPYTSIFTDKNKFKWALSLLKKNDDNKKTFVNVLNRTRKSLQDSLDFYAENTNSVLGEVERRYPIEGVVLTVKLEDGRAIKLKGTSKSFNEQKDSNWKVRGSLSSLEKKFNDSILKDVLGLKSSDDSFLKDKIQKVASRFRSSKVGEKRENEFIDKLLDEIQEVKIGEEEVRSNIKGVLDDAGYQLNIIKDQNQTASDPDTKAKNDAFLSRFESIIQFFKKYANVSYFKGDEFVNYIAKVILAKKIEPVMDSIKESINEDGTVTSSATEPTKCIVWMGRAQPWHIGHHKMLLEGIAQAKNRGVNEICIFVVHGEGTGKDVSKNPLTSQEQVKLIDTVYSEYDWSADGVSNDGITISVCEKPLKDGFLPNVLRRLYDENKIMSGLLVGEDGVSDYAKQLNVVDGNLSFTDNENVSHTAEYNVIDEDVNDIIIPISRSSKSSTAMSGTEARHLSTLSDFDVWVTKVAPKGISKNASVLYKDIFNEMSARLLKFDEDGYRGKMKGIFWGNI